MRDRLLSSFLASSAEAVQCRCGRALTVAVVASGVSVTCECGHTFCAGCRKQGLEGDFEKGQPHGPVTCDS